jgi:hypothetical protein
MKMYGKLAILAVGLLVGASQASASLVEVEGPFEGDSWGQRFQAWNMDFDSMEVVWVSGSLFEAPAFRNFTNDNAFASVDSDNVTTWTVVTDTSPTPSWATAKAGKVIDCQQFDIWFLGNRSAGDTFEFRAYLGTTVVESHTGVWNGSKWVYPVPLPSSAGVGLGMLATFGTALALRKRLHHKMKIC